MKSKKYTKEEDLVIIKAIKTNAKIIDAFKEAAVTLNRTTNGVSQRWYSTLSKQENQKKVLSLWDKIKNAFKSWMK